MNSLIFLNIDQILGYWKYYYDNGKMYFSPAFPWNATDGGANPTTLNNGGTLSAAATTIPVVSTAQFPASGTMTLASEMIHYTNITATSFLNSSSFKSFLPCTSSSSEV